MIGIHSFGKFECHGSQPIITFGSGAVLESVVFAAVTTFSTAGAGVEDVEGLSGCGATAGVGEVGALSTAIGLGVSTGSSVSMGC
jgi:hypothetical protein